MFWRVITILLSGLILVALQNGLVNFLPPPFFNLNLILSTLCFYYFLSGKMESVLFLGLWMGLLKDLFAPSFFGLNTLSILITLWLTKIFFEYFFTNRTLPSLLVLNVFLAISFHFTFVIFNAIAEVKFSTGFFLMSKEYSTAILMELILGSLILAILFFFVNHFTKKLKTNFLFTK